MYICMHVCMYSMLMQCMHCARFCLAAWQTKTNAPQPLASSQRVRVRVHKSCFSYECMYIHMYVCMYVCMHTYIVWIMYIYT
jgi:hypothetical protein